MPRDFRFGRRIALPATVQIKRELRIMMAADAVEQLRRRTAEHGADGPPAEPKPNPVGP